MVTCLIASQASRDVPILPADYYASKQGFALEDDFNVVKRRELESKLDQGVRDGAISEVYSNATFSSKIMDINHFWSQ